MGSDNCEGWGENTGEKIITEMSQRGSYVCVCVKMSVCGSMGMLCANVRAESTVGLWEHLLFLYEWNALTKMIALHSPMLVCVFPSPGMWVTGGVLVLQSEPGGALKKTNTLPLSPIPAHPKSLLSLRGITCPIIPAQSLALKIESLSVLLEDLEARSPPLCTHNQKNAVSCDGDNQVGCSKTS